MKQILIPKPLILPLLLYVTTALSVLSCPIAAQNTESDYFLRITGIDTNNVIVCEPPLTEPPDSGPYAPGQVVRMRPEATEDFGFYQWLGEDSGRVTDNGDGSYSVTMDSDVQLEAVFVEDPFYLTIEAGPGGTVLLEPPGLMISKEHRRAYPNLDDPMGPVTLTITALPHAGWQFETWGATDMAPEAPVWEITLEEDLDVGAHFVQHDIEELDLVSDLAFVLKETVLPWARNVSIERFDGNESAYQATGASLPERSYGPNGIPDAAEFHMLQVALTTGSLDQSMNSGVTHDDTWRAWQANLALAEARLSKTVHDDPRYVRVVAAYNTLGDFGSCALATRLVPEAGAPLEFERGQSLFFYSLHDADNDGQTNLDEWTQTEGLLFSERLQQFAPGALGLDDE